MTLRRIWFQNFLYLWSRLTFFCEDFRYSRDLAPLGTIESGLEFLDGIDDGSDVLIDVVEQEGLCPDSEILEGYEVSGSSAGNVEDEVSDWLREIEIVK